VLQAVFEESSKFSEDVGDILFEETKTRLAKICKIFEDGLVMNKVAEMKDKNAKLKDKIAELKDENAFLRKQLGQTKAAEK
jgi:uncharacterized small protein (DUF1192 family)